MPFHLLFPIHPEFVGSIYSLIAPGHASVNRARFIYLNLHREMILVNYQNVNLHFYIEIKQTIYIAITGINSQFWVNKYILGQLYLFIYFRNLWKQVLEGGTLRRIMIRRKTIFLYIIIKCR